MFVLFFSLSLPLCGFFSKVVLVVALENAGEPREAVLRLLCQVLPELPETTTVFLQWIPPSEHLIASSHII